MAAPTTIPADPRDLPDPARDPRVADFRAQIAQHERDADDLATKIEATRRDIARAQDAADDIAVRVVMGAAKPADEARARATLTEAQERLTDLTTRERATRAAIVRMRSIAAPAMDAAHDQARAMFHAAFAAKVRAMDEALECASQASEELWAIHAEAVARWGFNTTRRADGGTHPSVGGLMAMHWQDLAILGQGQHESTGSGARNFSKLELWREDARERGWIK